MKTIEYEYRIILSDNTTVDCDEYMVTASGLYYSKGTLEVFISNVYVKEIIR